jgi:hypothetical protein
MVEHLPSWGPGFHLQHSAVKSVNGDKRNNRYLKEVRTRQMEGQFKGTPITEYFFILFSF